MKEVFRIHTAHDMHEVAISKRALRCVAGVVLFLCALPSPQALAQHQHAHEKSAIQPHAAHEGQGPQSRATGEPGFIAVGVARFKIPDVEVLDQDGRNVHFYSDLIKGKVVVVSLFFTSCTFVCPMQGKALAKLKTRLAERLGEDVFFVSVSKDPAADTPERLKEWGAQFGVGRGWTLVTGAEDAMEKLLMDLTGSKPSRQMHDPIILIGNDRTGVWTEAGGLAETGELVEIIDRVSQPARSNT